MRRPSYRIGCLSLSLFLISSNAESSDLNSAFRCSPSAPKARVAKVSQPIGAKFLSKVCFDSPDGYYNRAAPQTLYIFASGFPGFEIFFSSLIRSLVMIYPSNLVS